MNEQRNKSSRVTKLSLAKTGPAFLFSFAEHVILLTFLQMCKIIDSFPAGADVVEKAFAAASLYYNYTGDQKCFQVEGGDDPHGLSGWGWQVKS